MAEELISKVLQKRKAANDSFSLTTGDVIDILGSDQLTDVNEQNAEIIVGMAISATKKLKKEREEKEKEREEKEKEREEKEKEREEKEKEREEKEKERKEKERIQKFAHWGDFLGMKLPKLVSKGGSTRASENPGHGDATLKVKPFGILEPPKPDLFISSTVLDHMQSDGTIIYCSEAEVHSHVANLIHDTIKAGELKLQCRRDYSMASYKPDLLLLCSPEGIPIGVIEVKVPDPDIMQSTKFFGQEYDYLRILRDLYGVKQPFGIITTYEQWRFCWLPEEGCDEKAASTVIPEIGNKAFFKKKSKAEIPFVKEKTDPPDHLTEEEKEQKKKEKEKEQREKEKEEDRIIHGTDIYQYDDPNLPKLILSLLIKMHSSEVKFMEPMIGRSYMSINQKSILGWKKLQKLNYNKYPSTKTTSFLLLNELGSGIEGRAWLACTFDAGLVCALKIFHKKGDDLLPRLLKQVEYWDKIWNLTTFVIELNAQDTLALAMPYVLIATKMVDGVDLNADAELKGPVLEALRRLVKSGYQHMDLKLGHVGFYKNGDGHIKALLVDLTLKEIAKGGKERAYHEMRNKLGLTE